VSFIQLENTNEYDELAPLLKCRLCDSIKVVFPQYNTSRYMKIVKTVYDVLLERYVSLELGNLSTTLSEALGIETSLNGNGSGGASGESVDYIIETNTSNGWLYRKWNSGIAECWYKADVGAIQGQYSNGGGYDTGTTSERFVLTPPNFPTDLFIDTPIVDCTIRGRERGFYSVPSVNPTATAVGSWYGHRNASLSSNQRAITFQFYCIGQWR